MIKEAPVKQKEGINQFGELPGLKQIGQFTRFVGRSIGEAVGEVYHRGRIFGKEFLGKLKGDEAMYVRNLSRELAYYGPKMHFTGVRKGFLDSMKEFPDIEDKDRFKFLYTRNVLGSLVEQGAISKGEEFEGHMRGFKKIQGQFNPDENLSRGIMRESTMDYLFAYASRYLVGSGAIKSPKDWDKLSDAVENVDGSSNKLGFIGHALPSLQKAGVLKTDNDFKVASWGFNELSKECFGENQSPSMHWIENVLETGLVKDMGDWRKLTQIIKKIPEKWREPTRVREGYGDALGRLKEKGWTLDQASERVDSIKNYADQHDGLNMIWKTGMDNFYGDIPSADAFPRALKFVKDDESGASVDGTLKPLTGWATGIFRKTISKDSFEAWTKAIEAGIPCEELMMKKRYLTSADPKDLKKLTVVSLSNLFDKQGTRDVAEKIREGKTLELAKGEEGETQILVKDSEGKKKTAIIAEKDEDGKYRLSVNDYRARPTKDGRMTVFSTYGGQDIVEFFQDKPENEKYKADVERQVGKISGDLSLRTKDGEIPTALNEAGINYGPERHMHSYNFVIKVEDGEAKVRIIDFDHAKVMKK